MFITARRNLAEKIKEHYLGEVGHNFEEVALVSELLDNFVHVVGHVGVEGDDGVQARLLTVSVTKFLLDLDRALGTSKTHRESSVYLTGGLSRLDSGKKSINSRVLSESVSIWMSESASKARTCAKQQRRW